MKRIIRKAIPWKAALFLSSVIFFVTPSFADYIPKDIKDNAWTAAYKGDHIGTDKYLNLRKPMSLEALLQNKLITLYLYEKSGDEKSKKDLLKEIDGLIKSQYLDQRQLDYDAKKLK
jgi:hypothetical protein